MKLYNIFQFILNFICPIFLQHNKHICLYVSTGKPLDRVDTVLSKIEQAINIKVQQDEETRKVLAEVSENMKLVTKVLTDLVEKRNH